MTKYPQEIKGFIETKIREAIEKLDSAEAKLLAVKKEIRDTKDTIRRAEQDVYIWINEVTK